MKSLFVLSTIAALGLSSLAAADWPQSFIGSHPATRGAGLITDHDGNVIVQGTVTIDPYNVRAVIVKYDRLGNFQWSKELTGFDNTSEYSCGVDGLGSVYVLGQADSTNDYRTVKLDANGNKVWTNLAHAKPATDEAYDSPTKVIGLPSGGCIVTGSSGNTLTSYDVYTLYYGPAGNKVWSRQLDIGGAAEYVDDMEINSLGDIFITGATAGADNGDMFVVKYDPTGHQDWVRKYDGQTYDEGRKLAVDGAGGVVVAARSNGANQTADGVIIRYDTNGNRQWTHRFFRAATEDQAADVKFLPDGSIVTLIPQDVLPLYELLVCRLDASGNKIWARTISHKDPDGGARIYYPMQLEVDPSGSVYVGYDVAMPSIEQQFLDKFTMDGAKVWEKSYLDDYTRFDGMTRDPVYGKIYTLGTSFVDGDHSSLAINKY